MGEVKLTLIGFNSFNNCSVVILLLFIKPNSLFPGQVYPVFVQCYAQVIESRNFITRFTFEFSRAVIHSVDSLAEGEKITKLPSIVFSSYENSNLRPAIVKYLLYRLFSIANTFILNENEFVITTIRRVRQAKNSLL